MRYIIEYMPGCKGDLLVRSLLGDDIVMGRFNKTPARSEYNLRKFMSRAWMSDEEIEITFNDLTAKISPAHRLCFLSTSYHLELIKKYQITIKKILFDARFYRTIHIENVIKNLHHHEPDLLAGPATPAEKLDELLRVGLAFYDDFNHQSTSYGRHLWSYENLYLNFNQYDALFEGFDWSKFRSNVERSWLPETFDLFGETWRPSEYGYKQW